MGTLRTELREEAVARVKLFVDIARAEACEMVGEDKRAVAYRERHS